MSFAVAKISTKYINLPYALLIDILGKERRTMSNQMKLIVLVEDNGIPVLIEVNPKVFVENHRLEGFELIS